MKFELGKEYRYKSYVYTYTCVGFTKKEFPILEASEKGIFSVYPQDFPDWKEVKEPREFWIVRLNPEASGRVFNTLQSAKNYYTPLHWPEAEIIHVKEQIND